MSCPGCTCMNEIWKEPWHLSLLIPVALQFPFGLAAVALISGPRAHVIPHPGFGLEVQGNHTHKCAAWVGWNQTPTLRQPCMSAVVGTCSGQLWVVDAEQSDLHSLTLLAPTYSPSALTNSSSFLLWCTKGFERKVPPTLVDWEWFCFHQTL